MPEIKAIIFDMDGVLIDAREWHYDALNRALGLFGYTIDRFDHLVTYDGLPTRRKLEMLTIDGGLPRSLHGFINALKQKYTMETVYSTCKPVFKHQYALARLQREGLRLVVASNSIRQTVDLMMERSSLAPYLEFTLSNEDVTAPKPDPEIYNTAIERLGLLPTECMILEDNPNGIRAAEDSGAQVMIVPSPEFVTYQNIRARIDETKREDR